MKRIISLSTVTAMLLMITASCGSGSEVNAGNEHTSDTSSGAVTSAPPP